MEIFTAHRGWGRRNTKNIQMNTPAPNPEIGLGSVEATRPSNGTFIQTETYTLPAAPLAAGVNYFHIASVDAAFKPSNSEK